MSWWHGINDLDDYMLLAIYAIAMFYGILIICKQEN
jgi:hypothetical protein